MRRRPGRNLVTFRRRLNAPERNAVVGRYPRGEPYKRALGFNHQPGDAVAQLPSIYPQIRGCLQRVAPSPEKKDHHQDACPEGDGAVELLLHGDTVMRFLRLARQSSKADQGMATASRTSQ